MKLAKRLFLLFAAGVFVLSLMNYLEHRTDAPREVHSSAAGSSVASGYLVRSDGQRLSVQPLSGGPVRYVDGVCISDLPAADREQLLRGLVLPDEAALIALLEDYTG